MAQVDVKGCQVEVDDNIAPLVVEMNKRGLETFGSCGGHPDPRKGQWEEGCWVVWFTVGKAPVDALGLLVQDLSSYNGLDFVRVDVEWRDEGCPALCCIGGDDGTDPQTVAAWLIGARNRREQAGGCWKGEDYDH